MNKINHKNYSNLALKTNNLHFNTYQKSQVYKIMNNFNKLQIKIIYNSMILKNNLVALMVFFNNKYH